MRIVVPPSPLHVQALDIAPLLGCRLHSIRLQPKAAREAGAVVLVVSSHGIMEAGNDWPC